MADDFLTTSSAVQCFHGGTVLLTTSNTSLFADDAPVLLETDESAVMNCLNTLPGPKPSPCIKIRWSGGADNVAVNGTPVLLKSSVGKCYTVEDAEQGTAIIGSTQDKGSGT